MDHTKARAHGHFTRKIPISRVVRCFRIDLTEASILRSNRDRHQIASDLVVEARASNLASCSLFVQLLHTDESRLNFVAFSALKKAEKSGADVATFSSTSDDDSINPCASAHLRGPTSHASDAYDSDRSVSSEEFDDGPANSEVSALIGTPALALREAPKSHLFSLLYRKAFENLDKADVERFQPVCCDQSGDGPPVWCGSTLPRAI